MKYPAVSRCCRFFRLSKARGVRIPAPQWRDNRRATRRKSGATRGARAPLGCLATLLAPHPAIAGRTARRSCLAIQAKPLSRGAAGYFNRLPDPGAGGVAPQSRLNVDFVVNSALVVKTLQIRQQGRPRELHRFWCWPQRSSHGQDQLGCRPCTLTRGPAPKSTTTLFYIAVFFLLFFLRKRRGEVPKKEISADIFRRCALNASAVRQASKARCPAATSFTALRGARAPRPPWHASGETHVGSFRRGARAPQH